MTAVIGKSICKKPPSESDYNKHSDYDEAYL